MTTCLIGIDVGLDGGIAALFGSGSMPMVFTMPTDIVETGPKKKPKKRRYVNGYKVRGIFEAIQNGAQERTRPEDTIEFYAMIERPQLRPAVRRDDQTGELKVNQGVASQAGFFEQYGLICGVMIGLGIAYEDIHPATWKADMFHGASDKKDARALATQLFPSAASHFARVKDDGLAEAVLLAEYLRRRRGAPF